jgi:DNA-binding response OmpR family regulator
MWVFLVDDDNDDLELVRDAFVRNQFRGELTSLDNAVTLMNTLKNPSARLPDLLILDLNMPLKDGFEVMTDLKDEDRFASMPIVVLTASSNLTDEKRCRELGCHLFFRKPVTVSEYDEFVTFIINFLSKLKPN